MPIDSGAHLKLNPPQTFAGLREGLGKYWIGRDGTQVDYDVFELFSLL